MLKYFIDSMKLYSFEEGQEIFKQGYPGSKFYIIGMGEVDVRIDQKSTC